MDDISQTFAWGVFLFCLGALGSLLFVIAHLLVRQLVHMAARLQPTTGVVREEDGTVARLVGGVLGPSYRPPFRYEYEVAGKPYRGNLVTLQIVRPTTAEALAAFGGKQPGDSITVLYDRDHPFRSVIDGRPPVLPMWIRLGTVVAPIVLVAGAVMMAVG